MRRLYDSGSYPAVGTVLGEAAWVEALSPEELADVLRSSLREEYADASDEEMGDALENVLDSMSAGGGVQLRVRAQPDREERERSWRLIRRSPRSCGRRRRSPAERSAP